MQYCFTKERWNSNDYSKLIEYINKIGDEKYRQFNSSLVLNIKKSFGIRIPILRQIGKEIAKGNWREYFTVCSDDYFEETMLQGLVLNYVKTDIDEILSYMDNFIKKIDNWAVCDSFCSGMKIIKNNKQYFYNYILKILSSDKPFEIRVGLVLLLDFYVDEDYIEKIFSLSSSITNDNYYVKMANAWLISKCFDKFREKTKIFLNHNDLDNWTYNKAIQKIIESRTTTSEEKIILKSMKK